ncbi:MAG: hypothetical protein D6800_03250 [Candidatus Zixiibacteriota bacterium]|nr:MAG: hypothetical protein D6800_03250 [candidate division Zixibacteria bacterium]
MTKKQLLSEIERLQEAYPDKFPEASRASMAWSKPQLEELLASMRSTTDDPMKSKDKDNPAPAPPNHPKKDAPSEKDAEAAFARVLETYPEARIYPLRQAMLILENPKVPGEKLVINAFGEMGSVLRDSPDRVPLRSSKEMRARRMGLSARNSVLVKTIPQWAYPIVFKLIQEGELGLFETEKDLKDYFSELDQPQVTGGMLEWGVATPAVVENEVDGPPGMLSRLEVKPGIEASTPEQKAAWRVINGTPDDPAIPEQVVADPRAAAEDEINMVKNRIEECLVAPRRYGASEPFDKKSFFNQLLELELRGFTPPRGTGRIGGTRPGVLRVIRALAKEHGYEVVGDYVVPENVTEPVALTDEFNPASL